MSHCSFFTKFKNKKRDREIKIESKKNLNKRNEIEKISLLSLILKVVIYYYYKSYSKLYILFISCYHKINILYIL